MSKDKKKKPTEVTRRQFLAGTGVVVGGAAIGSAALLSACGGEGATTTVTQTQTVTTTETVSKFACPYDSQEFSSLSALQTHMDSAHPGEAIIPGLITFTANGKKCILEIEQDWTLAFVLRERLGLFGTKVGCDRGECGTCTVLVDGRSVYACMMLAIEADGRDILTIEGLSDGITLHPIQQAFVDNNATQCGYCIPGYIMSTKALLDENPNPTLDEVKEALSGHYCTCGNTKKIVEAVKGG